MQYNWPGNVRELENCLERAAAMCSGDDIALEDLPEKVRKYRSEALPVAAQTSEEVVTLDELERRYIDRVLKIVSGNKSRAAELLGLDRRTLYRKLARSSVGAEQSM
jgi:two-component system response regulator HydG